MADHRRSTLAHIVEMFRRSRLVRYWASVFIWMAGIFYFSSRRDPLGFLPSSGHGIGVERLAHISEYAGLTALLHRALRGQGSQGAEEPGRFLPCISPPLHLCTDRPRLRLLRRTPPATHSQPGLRTGRHRLRPGRHHRRPGTDLGEGKASGRVKRERNDALSSPSLVSSSNMGPTPQQVMVCKEKANSNPRLT